MLLNQLAMQKFQVMRETIMSQHATNFCLRSHFPNEYLPSGFKPEGGSLCVLSAPRGCALEAAAVEFISGDARLREHEPVPA